MNQTTEPKNPLWAYFALVGGALFLLKSVPGILFMFLAQIRNQQVGVMTVFYWLIALAFIAAVIWGMKKALEAITAYRRAKTAWTPGSAAPPPSQPGKPKPIWPWIVIGLGGMLLISMGPGVLMLPIFPLFIAGMSTDSGTVPDYVPLLIVVIGYGLMIGYIVLLVKAIKALRAH